MDLKQLETYLCVCRRKSFSKAARELYISQPTASNHILALEEELNVLLINRSSNTLKLTHAGELFFDFAQRILTDRTKLNNSLFQISNTFTGVISIVSSSIPEVAVLPDIINRFRKLYPNATFKVHHLDSSLVIEELENKNFTFGFTGYKTKKSFLKFSKIAEDEMVIIEGKNSGFIKSSSSSINITNLIDIPFITREEGSGSKYFLNNILSKSNQIKFNIIAEIETTQLIKKLVNLNMGISFVSKTSLDDYDLKMLNVYTLEDFNLNRDLYFVYNPNQYLTPLEEKFKNLIIVK